MAEFPTAQLKPHPLNGEIYGETEPADDLVQSIRERGILEPLVIKQDGTIISGHRRWRAAAALKMESVPCRIVEYTDALDEQEAVIEFNRQRAKTSTQIMSETDKLYDIEKERSRLRQRLAGIANLPTVSSGNIALSHDEKGRTRDKVASAVGMKPRSFDKLRMVWRASKKGNEQASALMERLDKGQTTINAAYKQVVVSEAKRAAVDALEQTVLPNGLFNVIVADPPWQYEKRTEDETHRGRSPYPTMTTLEIASVEIPATENCIMWLWTTNAFMHDALHVLQAWGFEAKTILTWAKDRMGTGDWLRGQTEHCIMAVRGKPMVLLTNQTTIIHGPLREHSRKPEEFYALVEALCPGSKLEMFARSRREGWAGHGNELGRFPSIA